MGITSQNSGPGGGLLEPTLGHIYANVVTEGGSASGDVTDSMATGVSLLLGATDTMATGASLTVSPTATMSTGADITGATVSFQTGIPKNRQWQDQGREIVVQIGEKVFLNMNFHKELGSKDLSGTPDITITPSGPSISFKIVSGKIAQAYFDCSGVEIGDYVVTWLANDDSTPSQTMKMEGKLRVER